MEQGLAPFTVSLEGEDRQKYGSGNEQNKLLINRVADFRGSQPALSSPRVDWAEFQADFTMRKELENIENRQQVLQNKVSNAKTLHDYDNYQAAIEDYNYTSYSMNTNASDYEEKHRVLKQFFHAQVAIATALRKTIPVNRLSFLFLSSPAAFSKAQGFFRFLNQAFRLETQTFRLVRVNV